MFETKGLKAQIEVPSPVKDLKAQAVGKNRTKLTWSKSQDVEGYLVYAQKNGKYGYCGMTTNIASSVSFIVTKALDSD